MRLLGLSVYYQDVVGDNEGRMRDVIRLHWIVPML
mgnify:FL=1